jgi:hypothetical protein
MDVFPMFDDVIKIEPLKPLPLEDNSIGSIVSDLPFVIAKRNLVSKERSNVMINRFSSFYPTDELFENLESRKEKSVSLPSNMRFLKYFYSMFFTLFLKEVLPDKKYIEITSMKIWEK